MTVVEKKEFRAICSDLDHTLLMPDKSISEKTGFCLRTLMERGMEVIPCTGRSFCSLPESVTSFPGIRYVVVSNGAAVYDLTENKAIIRQCLREDFAGTLMAFLQERKEPVTFECFVEGQAYTSQAYFNEPADFGIPGEIEKRYVQSTRMPVPDIRDFILENGNRLEALDVILPPPARDKVSEMIKEEFPDIYLTTSVPHLIEISHVLSGKHRGIEKLARRLGFGPDQVIAFGDGDNDSEMLGMAGLGIAVDNASERCKKAADLIIGPSREESVACFLMDYFSIQI